MSRNIDIRDLKEFLMDILEGIDTLLKLDIVVGKLSLTVNGAIGIY